MPDDVDQRMREVLVQLALTSNAPTLNYEGSSSGASHSDLVPALGLHDAPQLYYAARYDRAETLEEREAVLDLAERELESIRRSSGDPSKEESKQDRDKRIIERGEGIPAAEVAVWARCTTSSVRAARRAAGREEELGKVPVNGRALGPGLRDEIIRRIETGTPARQVAKALSLSYSTVLRAIGRKT